VLAAAREVSSMFQKQSLMNKLSVKDRNLLVLKTELVRLFNVTVRVKDIIAKSPELEEIRELPISRLEDAHKTLRSFVEQYERKTTASRPSEVVLNAPSELRKSLPAS